MAGGHPATVITAQNGCLLPAFDDCVHQSPESRTAMRALIDFRRQNAGMRLLSTPPVNHMALPYRWTEGSAGPGAETALHDREGANGVGRGIRKHLLAGLARQQAPVVLGGETAAGAC
jgi:hypothetical protein